MSNTRTVDDENSNMADEAGEEVDLNLTKAEASKKIDELQQKTGRGVN